MFTSPASLTKPTFPVNVTMRSTTREDAVTNDTMVTNGEYEQFINYGKEPYIYVGYIYNNWSEIYLNFSTTTAPANPTKAEICLVFSSMSVPFEMNVSLVTQPWVETALTWNGKPDYGPSIATMEIASTDVTYKVDVTDYIATGSSFSVCLNASGPSETGYGRLYSHESTEPEAPGARLV